jgi:hypothetical protein
MAMTKVMEAMVFTTEVTNVGDVYLRLAKYMFRVKLTLQFNSQQSCVTTIFFSSVNDMSIR